MFMNMYMIKYETHEEMTCVLGPGLPPSSPAKGRTGGLQSEPAQPARDPGADTGGL